MGRDKKAFIASLTIHSLFACSVSERNMGQSLYLWFDSAGFCCWGLGMGRPFPTQITTQGHRGTFFRVDIWRSWHSASPGGGTRGNPVGVAIRSREDHSDEKITNHEVGWSPLRNHP